MSGTVESLKRVRLEDVSVKLFWAVEEHHADILRESALMTVASGNATTSGEDADSPLQRLVTLLETIRARYAEQRGFLHERMVAAVRNGEERVTVELLLPEESADAAEVLLAAFEAADEACRAGALLTLAASEEVAAFRRQHLIDIIRQLRQ